MYSALKMCGVTGMLSSKEIGSKLKELRKRRGLTQEKLAEQIDVTFQQIQQYENGSNRLNTDKLQLIAKALSVPIGAFFNEVDDERTLSDEEKLLINRFRSVESIDIRNFVLKSLSGV
jgi:transcriptional regulator with XRE-family HTH domain